MRLRRLIVLVGILVVIAGAVQLLRGVPEVRISPALASDIRLPGAAPSLPWPSSGQATVAVQGVGSFGSVGGNQPVPIASMAKMMTAQIILTDHPLAPGASGPSIAVDAAAVATEKAEAAQFESVVAVVAGESLTERQALEALLIPSGNNIALLLADWDAGNEAAFVAKMNAEARALGMTHTHYADTSGFSSATVSTAIDQMKLLKVVMANPVFAHIVAMPQVTLPVAGLVYNYDYNLGHNGFVGVKTGSDGAAGGCFAFAVDHRVDGHAYTILGVVLGQQGKLILQAALNVATALANAVTTQVAVRQAVAPGLTAARLLAPWTTTVAATTRSSASVLGWSGLEVPIHLDVRVSGRRVPANSQIGVLEVGQAGERTAVPISTTKALANPSLVWKLTR
ncbi:MAG: D-alanyl-D-alanine carboxypeptidase family protein [Acidimicrobiales bacterium]